MNTQQDTTFENWLLRMSAKKRAFYARNPVNRPAFSTRNYAKPEKPKRYRGLWQQKFHAIKGTARTLSAEEKRRYAEERGLSVAVSNTERTDGSDAPRDSKKYK